MLEATRFKENQTPPWQQFLKLRFHNCALGYWENDPLLKRAKCCQSVTIRRKIWISSALRSELRWLGKLTQAKKNLVSMMLEKWDAFFKCEFMHVSDPSFLPQGAGVKGGIRFAPQSDRWSKHLRNSSQSWWFWISWLRPGNARPPKPN